MRNRWAIMLVTVNVLIASLMVFAEEARSCESIRTDEKLDEMERLLYLQGQRSHRAEPPPHVPNRQGEEVRGDMSNDYWPSVRVREVYEVNVPALLLVGWYRHPEVWPEHPPLRPMLLPLLYRLRLRARVIVMDVLMLFLIGLQWWAIGSWIGRRPRKWRTIPAKILLACAAVFLSLEILPKWITGAAGDLQLLPTLSALLAWLWLMISLVASAGVAAKHLWTRESA